MPGLSLPRRLLKLVHPEGIPWPGSALYNALTSAQPLQRHYYGTVAQDIVDHCSQGALLDIGTGPGWLLLRVHECSEQMQLVGIDASAAMAHKARVNVGSAGLDDAVHVLAGNADHLPLADASVDVVVSTGSIHHWKSPALAMGEIHRVLKPGGYALLYDVVTDTPSAVLRGLARCYGWLWVVLFWLHGFQEPFYGREAYEALPHDTPFSQDPTRFVAGMCCLQLRKVAD